MDGDVNAVTVVSDDNLQGFNLAREVLDVLGVDMDGDLSNSVMRLFGEGYDVQGVFDFVDENAKNVNTQTDLLQPIDGIGDFHYESLHEPIKPLMIAGDLTNQNTFNIGLTRLPAGGSVTDSSKLADGRLLFDYVKMLWSSRLYSQF